MNRETMQAAEEQLKKSLEEFQRYRDNVELTPQMWQSMAGDVIALTAQLVLRLVRSKLA